MVSGSEPANTDASPGSATGGLASARYLLRLDEELAAGSAELPEWVRGAGCLVRVGDALRRPGRKLEDSLQEVADLLPSAFTAPAGSAARIRRGDDTWVSGDFRETEWRRSQPIEGSARTASTVEMALLAAPPDRENPFTEQERHFLEAVAGILADAFAREAEEGRVRQKDKMHALGKFSGGVAHHFNNLLTVILGHAEMALGDLPPGSELRDDMREIIGASLRGNELTRPLLALSQRQALAEEVQDLRTIVSEMEPLLRRLVPSRIGLDYVATGEPVWVKVDAPQMDLVLRNMVKNAAEAIEGTGRITLRVDQEDLSSVGDSPRAVEASPGTYARLTVMDTGRGMPREVVDRVFEPFYTTRPVGDGVGLGLSTVFGIVGQGGGFLRVESRPEEGTRFEVLLPAQPAPQRKPPSEATPGWVQERGSSAEGAVVLLVDDDSAVRNVTEKSLARAGYRVLTAESGEAALEVAERHGKEIQIVVTDMIMPGMAGAELLNRLTELRPELPVILMSGYSDRELGGEPPSNAAGFLRKPFGPPELVRLVRETLER